MIGFTGFGGLIQREERVTGLTLIALVSSTILRFNRSTIITSANLDDLARSGFWIQFVTHVTGSAFLVGMTLAVRIQSWHTVFTSTDVFVAPFFFTRQPVVSVAFLTLNAAIFLTVVVVDR
jgi:hypothetical protein